MQSNPLTADTPVELQLLVACLKPSGGSPAQMLGQTLDWEYVISMAEWHGVLPLVARSLGAEAAVPSLLRERLRQSAFAIAARNLHIASIASRLARHLEAASIPVISYKGVVLSQMLYGTTAMRPVADIDLIIRPENFAAAVRILREQGFDDRFGFTDAQRSAVLSLGFEHGFHGDGVNIDLHWRVAQRFVWPCLSMDRAWRATKPLTFLGTELRVFTPEAMLAALCVHAAQDEWIFLKSFADIAQTIQLHPDLDWNEFLLWFGDSHSRRSMIVALQLAHDYFDAALPVETLEVLGSDPHAQVLATWVVSQWASAIKPVPEQAQVSQWMFHTRGERLRDRMRYVAGVLLQPTLEDFQSASFGPALRWLYYAVRPFRIAAERSRRMAGRRGEVTKAHV